MFEMTSKLPIPTSLHFIDGTKVRINRNKLQQYDYIIRIQND
jgi:hypothetical protein